MSGWCIYKLRTDWIPTPTVWEQQPYIQKAISAGAPLPLVTPFYEVDIGQRKSGLLRSLPRGA